MASIRVISKMKILNRVIFLLNKRQKEQSWTQTYLKFSKQNPQHLGILISKLIYIHGLKV